MTFPAKPDYAAALAGLLACTVASEPEALAARLLSEFGCYSGVFDAPADRLLKTEAVSEETAALIKLFPALCGGMRRQETPMPKNIGDKSFGDALTARFYGCCEELLTAVAADRNGRILGVLELRQSRYSRIELYIPQIVDFAVRLNAAGVVLAHNHPDGFAIPSADDNAASAALRRALWVLNITLCDHIIVAGDDYVSMRDSADYGEIR